MSTAQMCKVPGCHDPQSTGSVYCDDHLLSQQVAAQRRARAAQIGQGGTLATLIRQAAGMGLLQPQAAYISNAA